LADGGAQAGSGRLFRGLIRYHLKQAVADISADAFGTQGLAAGGRVNLVQSVKKLGLPDNSYVVVGSGVLDALGLRTASDIDIVVSHDVYHQLKHRGWSGAAGPKGQETLNHERFEVSTVWDSPWGDLALPELLPDTMVVDDVRFVSLPSLLAWKEAVGRPKDLEDSRLIKDYLDR
jgi:hypothetical protein